MTRVIRRPRGPAHVGYTAIVGLAGAVAVAAALWWPGASPLADAPLPDLAALFVLAAAARLLVFRIYRDVSVALDSTFYVAACFAFGAVPAALLAFTVLSGEALVRWVLRGPLHDDLRGSVSTLAACLFQGGLPALMLLALGGLFDLRHALVHDDPTLACMVMALAASFLGAHYGLAGIGHWLLGTPAREVWRSFVAPVVLAELTPTPIGLAMVYGYGHQGLVQFLLIGSSGLLFNWIFRRAHIARGKLQERVAELSTLNKVGQLISGSLERRVLFKNIAGEALRLVGHSSRFMIGLMRDNRLEVDYEVFEEGGKSSQFASSSQEALMRWMLANRKPLLLNHYGPELAAYVAGAALTDRRFQSCLAVPLITSGEVIGVMSVLSEMRNAYNPDHLRVLATVADQSAVAIENARLYELATVDGLTGLLVRRHFEQRLEHEWRRAQRYSDAFSLGLLDLDDFKGLNDTYGHQAGDHVLRAAARVVRSNMRATDLAGRYGGEEFVFVLPRTAVGEAWTMAERIRADIEALRIDWSGQPLVISASLGIAGYPDWGRECVSELIAQADEALYDAKRGGKNRVIAAPGSAGTEAIDADSLAAANSLVVPRL